VPWELALTDAASVTVQPQRVELGGQPILLVRLDDGVHALHDTCLHRAVSLAEGTVEGGLITCSAHFWSFDLRSGTCTQLPEQGLRVFNTKIEEGKLYVEV
jgi:nitrite reductase/ring-hydroxylating ferredoxin subunit